jgi:hypothetical protein
MLPSPPATAAAPASRPVHPRRRRFSGALRRPRDTGGTPGTRTCSLCEAGKRFPIRRSGTKRNGTGISPAPLHASSAQTDDRGDRPFDGRHARWPPSHGTSPSRPRPGDRDAPLSDLKRPVGESSAFWSKERVPNLREMPPSCRLRSGGNDFSTPGAHGRPCRMRSRTSHLASVEMTVSPRGCLNTVSGQSGRSRRVTNCTRGPEESLQGLECPQPIIALLDTENATPH